MNYEAGFCVFAFIVFCCVLVYALYRRALAVDFDNAARAWAAESDDDVLLSRDDVLDLATHTHQPMSDGWIDWHGGECPVPDGTIVDVKWRNGTIHENQQAWEDGYYPSCEACSYAGFAFWRHEPQENDIIAYRVCGQSDVPVPDRVQSVSNTAAPMPKGWQPWEGGVYFPLPSNTKIAVMFGSGDIQYGYTAKDYHWQHCGDSDDEITTIDILAYRIAD